MILFSDEATPIIPHVNVHLVFDTEPWGALHQTDIGVGYVRMATFICTVDRYCETTNQICLDFVSLASSLALLHLRGSLPQCIRSQGACSRRSRQASKPHHTEGHQWNVPFHSPTHLLPQQVPLPQASREAGALCLMLLLPQLQFFCVRHGKCKTINRSPSPSRKAQSIHCRRPLQLSDCRFNSLRDTHCYSVCTMYSHAFLWTGWERMRSSSLIFIWSRFFSRLLFDSFLVILWFSSFGVTLKR